MLKFSALRSPRVISRRCQCWHCQQIAQGGGRDASKVSSDPCSTQDLSCAFVRCRSNDSSDMASTPSHWGLFHSLTDVTRWKSFWISAYIFCTKIYPTSPSYGPSHRTTQNSVSNSGIYNPSGAALVVLTSLRSFTLFVSHSDKPFVFNS